MSVARRELKAAEELRQWIEGHASSSGVSDEGGMPPFEIVRRSPRCGVADWNVVSGEAERGVRRRWNSALRHAVRTARLRFDMR